MAPGDAPGARRTRPGRIPRVPGPAPRPAARRGLMLGRRGHVRRFPARLRARRLRSLRDLGRTPRGLPDRRDRRRCDGRLPRALGLLLGALPAGGRGAQAAGRHQARPSPRPRNATARSSTTAQRHVLGGSVGRFVASNAASERLSGYSITELRAPGHRRPDRAESRPRDREPPSSKALNRQPQQVDTALVPQGRPRRRAERDRSADHRRRRGRRHLLHRRGRHRPQAAGG